jgi:hypothetical protein
MKIGRNDLCPCGSGKKFKNCHLGREAELLGEVFQPDKAETAQLISELPPCRNRRALEIAGQLELASNTGKAYQLKLVDLAAYQALNLDGKNEPPAANAEGGVFINPNKTKSLEPNTLYLAISPGADESTVLHQFAHALDLIQGSRLPVGQGRELANELTVPSEMLEHPQEFGDILKDLAERFEVTLDADDEIVSLLAERELLLPGQLIRDAKQKEVTDAMTKAITYLRDHAQDVDARIKNRSGYQGSKPK